MAVRMGRIREIVMSSGGLTVLALTAVMAMDTSDQSAIGATAPQVRAHFGISSTQIGLLATSSTVVGVIFTIPFGMLADRTKRTRVLRIIVAVWTAAMVLVGAAPNFPTMLLAHSILGLVTGAAPPLVASLIGDLVPAEQRGRAYSALLLGELLGSAVGLSVSGEIAAFFGWRYAYWALAIAGVLVMVTLRWAVEPNRRPPPGSKKTGRGKGVGTTPTPTLLEAIKSLLRNRTNVMLIVASAAGYYFFAGVQTFAVSLLREAYGVSAGTAPLYVLFIGLALAVGVLIGGPVGDRLRAARPLHGRLPILLIAFAGSLLFIVPALAVHEIGLTLPLLIIGGVLLGSANPPLDATRIEIVASALVGRAEAVRNTVRDGADATAPILFGAIGAAIGLHDTFLWMTSSLVLALVLCLFAVRSYPRDAAAAGVDIGEMQTVGADPSVPSPT